MSLSIPWNRLDAPRWVGRWLVLQTLVLGYLTFLAALDGLGPGRLWVVGALGLLTAVQGALTSAWYAERRWASWVQCAFQGLGVLELLGTASGRSPLAVIVGLLMGIAAFALLLHPATRARLERPAPRPPASWRAPSEPPHR